jgi:putative heme-binding domain-containing protein
MIRWTLFFVASVLWAQHGEDSRANPFNTASDVESGRVLYRNSCAVCHGIDGKGGRGTDLTLGKFRRGAADEDLFRTISKGIPGTEMPPIFFEGRQLWQLVAYIRSLSVGRAAAKVNGDAAQGRLIFEGKGKCLSCHRIHDRGSRTGPDLSEIGAASSVADLESALLRPAETILPKNRWVRVTLANGRQVTGRRMNEDTFSVQLMDADERLVSILKANARSTEVLRTSPMPSYEGKLSRQEINDLIAYLAGLRP